MDEEKRKDLLKNSILKIESLQNEVTSLKNQINEPIAIIGMSCRCPNGGNSPEEFWNLLINNVDCISKIPKERFDIEHFYSPLAGTPGKTYAKEGGYLNYSIKQFDAEFFNILPREAISLDPQERLLLELVVESIENAGIHLQDLTDSLSGVFVGISYHDYETYMFRNGKEEDVDLYTLTGNLSSINIGRLSYVLGLNGPSIALDTACSSSISAMHLACQSLRNRECEVAFAGGVNVICAPELYLSLSMADSLAHDSRCKTFDKEADGFVRSEGGGILTLKRYSDAVKNKDHILGVIKGSYINHDGASSGLTVPNGVAQQQLIERALANAGAHPDDIDYFECHGTGTSQGDPIEVDAISEVFAGRKRPLYLGSVKSNVGHMEPAAGIAGVIKTLLAFRHDKIPSNLHFKTLNPEIQLSGFQGQIVDKNMEWPKSKGKKRLASISAFGLGGTNAHVIIEEADREEEVIENRASDKPNLFLYSAKSINSLINYVQTCENLIKKNNENIDEIAYGSFLKEKYPWKLCIPYLDKADLLTEFERFISDREQYEGCFKLENKITDRKLAFVFSGQGPQFWPFDQRILKHAPVMKSVLEECNASLRKWGNVSILEHLNSSDKDLDTRVVQSMLCAIQISLAKQLIDWGVIPNVVIGHSLGEIAAACVSGALDVQEAMKIVYFRTQSMSEIRGKGLTAFVNLSEEKCKEYIKAFPGALSIAGINSPEETIIAGNTEAIEQVIQRITAEGIFCKILESDKLAFHSFQIDKILNQFESSLKGITLQNTKIPFYSTVLNRKIEGKELGPSYWGKNLRQTVLFGPSITSLIQDNVRSFIEIGAHPVLKRSIKNNLLSSKTNALVWSSLKNKENSSLSLSRLVGNLYNEGYHVPVESFVQKTRINSNLPTYQWNRETFWVEERDQGSFYGEQRKIEDCFEIAWIPLKRVEKGEISKKTDSLLFSTDQAVSSKLKDCISTFESLLEKIENPKIKNIYFLPPISECKNPEDSKPLSDTIASQLIDQMNLLKRLRLLKRPIKLWIITTGAIQVKKDEIVNISHAPYLGLAKIWEKEVPDFFGGLVDFASLDSFETFSEFHELALLKGDFSFAVRGKDLYLPRAKVRDINVETKEAFPANYTALIVGGLGNLGRALIDRFVKNGVRNFLLIGRSPLNLEGANKQTQDKVKFIQDHQSKGIDIQYESCDVANFKELEKLVQKYQRDKKQIHGVFHLGADTSDFGYLMDSSEAEIRNGLYSKIVGTLNLHYLFSKSDLLHFVLFSSIASILTEAAESSGVYPVANAFLDGFSFYRAKMGLPILVINWGLWEETSSLVRGGADALKLRFHKKGIKGFSNQSGLNFLENVLFHKDIHSCVYCPIDLTKLKESEIEDSVFRLFSDCFPRATSKPSGEKQASRPQDLFLKKFFDLGDHEEQKKILAEYLKGKVQNIMKIQVDSILPEKSLKSYGIDSIMATEMRTGIQKIHCNVPIIKIIREYSINDLINECYEQLITKKESILADLVSAPPTESSESLAEPKAEKRETEFTVASEIKDFGSYIVPKVREAAQVNIFAFPYAGGSPAAFNTWYRNLNEEIQFNVIQLPGRGNRYTEAPYRTLKSAVDELARELLPALEEKPFIFFGHCLGNLIAYELIHELKRTGKPLPFHFFVSGARAPQHFTQEQLNIDFISESPVSGTPGHKLNDEKFLEMLTDFDFGPTRSLLEDRELARIILPYVKADFEINNTYIYQKKEPLDIPITVIGGRVDPYVTGAQILDWEKHTTQAFNRYFVPGNHYFIDQAKDFIVQKLNEIYLEKTQLLVNLR